MYGRGFAKGFNEFDWGTRVGGGVPAPSVDVGRALRAAAARPSDASVYGIHQTRGRVGFVGMGVNRANAWSKKQRDETRPVLKAQIQGRLRGDEPSDEEPPPFLRQDQMSSPSPTATESVLWTPPARSTGPARERTSTFSSTARGGRDPLLDSNPNPGDFGDPFASPAETGGRAHVGGVSDRIGPIIERVTTSSTMNDVAKRVLSGGLGGPMTVPKLIFGAARSARRRK